MEDDDDFLALAFGSKGRSGNKNKRRREVSSSDESDSSKTEGEYDDEQDAKGEDDDNEDDYDSPRFSSLKSNTSKQPKKSKERRSRAQDDDDEGESDREDESVDAMRKKIRMYDDRGYGNSEDRDKLSKMPEFEREQILAERLDQKQQWQERLEVKERLQQVQQDARRSSRKVESKVSKNLSKLKKERKSSKAAASESSSRKKKKYSDDDDSDSKYGDSDDDKKKGSLPVAIEIKLEDLRSIQIRRSDIQKWVFHPFFKSLVTGCVARLGLGLDPQGNNAYRLVVITDTQESNNPYKLDDGFVVNQEIKVSHGKSSKTFKMATVSNEWITQAEFDRWKKTMEVDGLKLMSVKDVTRKKQEIKSRRERALTSEEITLETNARRQFNVVAHTIREKATLQRLQEEATKVDNKVAADRYKMQLERLEYAMEEEKRRQIEKARHLDQINDANRKKNVQEVKAAEVAAVQAKLEKGDSGLDPFARRRTLNFRMLGKEKSPEKSPSLGPTPNTSTTETNGNPQSSPSKPSSLRPASMSPLPMPSPARKIMNSQKELGSSPGYSNNGATPPVLMGSSGAAVVSSSNGNSSTTASAVAFKVKPPSIKVVADDDEDDSFLDSLDL
ncbi:hypothetical protein SmJEL517_g02971 [Synchytrium microbalum]|uniref:Plus3 domain-containing protein n=1 Tax=Synchytrium microbalum TaxID=1806994 RepID=A0A507C8S9_9FUNG|nr:uncharacterized protein SmJEL517_g02971 [Synchytrium microbalum]TPX34396.1 hypothetical protein SmJEL517_g02971 [Synchytrium microbalum]